MKSKSLQKLLLAFATFVSVLTFSMFAPARAGTLDQSFGTGGIVYGTPTGLIQISNAILQPDGKIILVGGVNPTYNSPPQDFAVWRSSNRAWYIRNSSNGAVSGTQWGLSTDIPVPGN